MDILTVNGWQQLCPRHNDIGQPAKVPPLKADGKHVPFQDPDDYSSCGRYIGPQPSPEFVSFCNALSKEARELTEFRISRHGYDTMVTYDEDERPKTRDKWGVAVKIF